jgi:polyadenylate-binding protein
LVQGKNIYVVKAVKKDERKKQLVKESVRKNIYIKNFHPTLKESDIESLLEENKFVGSKVTISRDDKGNSKGFGFVCFFSQDTAMSFVKAC